MSRSAHDQIVDLLDKTTLVQSERIVIRDHMTRQQAAIEGLSRELERRNSPSDAIAVLREAGIQSLSFWPQAQS